MYGHVTSFAAFRVAFNIRGRFVATCFAVLSTKLKYRHLNYGYTQENRGELSNDGGGSTTIDAAGTMLGEDVGHAARRTCWFNVEGVQMG